MCVKVGKIKQIIAKREIEPYWKRAMGYGTYPHYEYNVLMEDDRYHCWYEEDVFKAKD